MQKRDIWFIIIIIWYTLMTWKNSNYFGVWKITESNICICKFIYTQLSNCRMPSWFLLVSFLKKKCRNQTKVHNLQISLNITDAVFILSLITLSAYKLFMSNAHGDKNNLKHGRVLLPRTLYSITSQYEAIER